jgi:nucleotide-binding universal stress UspA family protein
MDVLPKKIVLATDGSEDAALATRAAAHLSKQMGAGLYITHAWRPWTQHSDRPALMWNYHAHLYEREARRVLVGIGAGGALNYVWPVTLVLGGLYLILRAFGPGRRPRPHG